MSGLYDTALNDRETLELAQQGDLWKAGANVVLQVVLGLVAAWVGFALVRYL